MPARLPCLTILLLYLLLKECKIKSNVGNDGSSRIEKYGKIPRRIIETTCINPVMKEAVGLTMNSHSINIEEALK